MRCGWANETIDAIRHKNTILSYFLHFENLKYVQRIPNQPNFRCSIPFRVENNYLREHNCCLSIVFCTSVCLLCRSFDNLCSFSWFFFLYQMSDLDIKSMQKRRKKCQQNWLCSSDDLRFLNSYNNYIKRKRKQNYCSSKNPSHV